MPNGPEVSTLGNYTVHKVVRQVGLDMARLKDHSAVKGGWNVQ